jgi:hypothetical protein
MPCLDQRPTMAMPSPKRSITRSEEVLFLKAANGIIDLMVNREVLALHEATAGSSILFTTSTHQRLFNIWLVDFLSPTDPELPVESMSFLNALERRIGTASTLGARPDPPIGPSVASNKPSTWYVGRLARRRRAVDDSHRVPEAR